MPTAALVISLISASFVAAGQGVTLVQQIENLHHHTTAVVYRHVLKPIGHGVKKAVK
jgi:hypothetical protein